MEQYFLAFFIPAAAMLLDSLFGDPRGLPHPVRWIGKGLDLYEASARRVGFNLRAAGWTAVVLFGAGALLLAEILMAIPYVGVLIAVYLAYAGLAMGCLVREARQVAARLDDGDLDGARRALSMLVSRDTSVLDAQGVRRTLAETVSENLNDGFVAPMFYLAIFGPGGMWAYKAVSTMDSMWGYRTERFRDLGRGAARTDDVLAWIPARITAWALLITGRMRGLDYRAARANLAADAMKMESPNAGWPMAAAAWLMDAGMGGRAVYFGKVKEKPVLGPGEKPWDRAKIRALIALCKVSGHRAGWVFILLFGWLRIAF
ncbi:adenosylcobinamide-phosphate synthase CbiB [Pseudodesulfovibrio sp.]|uniref:adenosylcobinamide-phosphate synthase CbiB n=1 Tax=Pseudodesulfovibrio sp. TaxID=2035812 RepID=UPI002611ACDE|nr:adenosylcobinamide-phosphate synthase CbiB [Pseudodesulfovibrio sp.]MDD3312037.1 adenosylcobinamide-phosphate synthase CbiB [Pseudodesulfovibrio sp.]